MATEASTQDDNFTAFGFGKNARRNLVIAIMTIQFSAIAGLFKYSMVLNKKINDIQAAQADSSNAMYKRLVQQIATKLTPVNTEIKDLSQNIAKTDSLQNKIIKDNKLPIK